MVLAAYTYVDRGGSIDRTEGRLLRGLGKTVARQWRLPDHGIWEVRGTPAHYTHSKVMCWVALDRLIRMHEGGHLKVPVDAFARERDAIRKDIGQRGFNAGCGAYTIAYGSQWADATLLLISRYGYHPPDAPEMVGTHALVRRQLARGPLLYRYPPSFDDRMPPGEAPFVITSFWQPEYLAQRGDTEAAVELMEQLLGRANDVGLYSEEQDPDTGAHLGNFPQAFSHAGLIAAALSLAEPGRT